MKGPIRTIIYVIIVFFLVIALVWKALTFILLKGDYKSVNGNDLLLTEEGYFTSFNSSVLFFNNNYPEGKQGGVEVILHDERLITNGDLRIEPTPEQWDVLPKLIDKNMERETNSGLAELVFEKADLKYSLRIQAEKNTFILTLDLDEPLPKSLFGKVGLNLELLPSAFEGSAYMMDESGGIFPKDAFGEMKKDKLGEFQAKAMAEGARLILSPEDPSKNIVITQEKGLMSLIDGRNKAQNGWFVIRALVPEGASKNAIVWEIQLNHIKGWLRPPKILHSQVGYHPDQNKKIFIEMTHQVKRMNTASLFRISSNGQSDEIIKSKPVYRGKFQRYHYYEFDISKEKSDGLYYVVYENQKTTPFIISREVYQKNTWQPTIDTFFPVQMDHLSVRDRYRVWHGKSHMDDAMQAPPGLVHFDGYEMGDQTWTKYDPFEHIPYLNDGGWYDAGDYDIRTISQVNTVFWLALAHELFDVPWDQTTVDYKTRNVEIRVPDGKQDILQQVEHGARYLLGCYQSMGHAIPGIIVPTIRQYVHLGDGMTMTDNLLYDHRMDSSESDGFKSGIKDDRLAFTNKSSALDYAAVRALAMAGKAMEIYNPELAEKCKNTAAAIWEDEQLNDPVKFEGGNTYSNRLDIEMVNATATLLNISGNEKYRQAILEMLPLVEKNIQFMGITVGLVHDLMDEDFNTHLRSIVNEQIISGKKELMENPFNIPYNPGIWGIAWGLQEKAANLYLLKLAFPEIVDNEEIYSILNYVYGVHPGSNVSLVSGVGSHSLTKAYGLNRADFSYIPGGVASGPGLIRPDFPELKENWPFLWQQSEYVIDGAATYVFTVLAADQLLN